MALGFLCRLWTNNQAVLILSTSVSQPRIWRSVQNWCWWVKLKLGLCWFDSGFQYSILVERSRYFFWYLTPNMEEDLHFPKKYIFCISVAASTDKPNLAHHTGTLPYILPHHTSTLPYILPHLTGTLPYILAHQPGTPYNILTHHTAHPTHRYTTLNPSTSHLPVHTITS